MKTYLTALRPSPLLYSALPGWRIGATLASDSERHARRELLGVRACSLDPDILPTCSSRQSDKRSARIAAKLCHSHSHACPPLSFTAIARRNRPGRTLTFSLHAYPDIFTER
jgi:hypothetical protein